jgi:hypothetical protein
MDNKMGTHTDHHITADTGRRNEDARLNQRGPTAGSVNKMFRYHRLQSATRRRCYAFGVQATAVLCVFLCLLRHLATNRLLPVSEQPMDLKLMTTEILRTVNSTLVPGPLPEQPMDIKIMTTLNSTVIARPLAPTNASKAELAWAHELSAVNSTVVTRPPPEQPVDTKILTTLNSTVIARPLAPTNASLAWARELSSVDYRTCCGLGHRMSKMSDAYYVASKLGFGLRGYWGDCNGTEIFNFMFGPQPPDELSNVTNRSNYLRINNEVPGFSLIVRDGSNESNFDTCACSLSKSVSDVSFYSGLRRRFFARNKVEEFRKTHDWNNPDVLVIGMHARTGNGEMGDFASRGRTIPDLDSWMASLSKLLLQLTTTLAWGNRTVELFIATDTPSVVPGMRSLLKDHITVATYEQSLPQAGQGVLFGEHGKVAAEADLCRDGWENSFIDMSLLSYADLVVAARPSSFVQSMPMSLAISRPLPNRKVNQTYCEVNGNATEFQCFASIQEWCCNGRTAFALAGIQNYDYLNVPVRDFHEEMSRITARPQSGCSPDSDCFPYDWNNPSG